MEETVEGVGETSPLCQPDLLCVLSDDDDAVEPSVEESPHSTGVVMRSGATPSWRLGRATPKKGEEASLPRGDTSALSPVIAALRPAVECLADAQGATKPALKKVGSSLALARKRVYIATDE